MNRKNLLLPFIFLSLNTLNAVDFTLGDTIIESAVEATDGLQSAMENVMSSGEELVSSVAETIELPLIEENHTVVPENIIEVDESLEHLPEATTLPLEETSSMQTPPEIIPQVITKTVEIVPASTLTVETNTTVVTSTDTLTNKEINESEEEEEEEATDIMEGSIEEGHKIFLTHIKPVCGITGAEFAANYSQEEWEEILEAGEFKKVLIQLCPKAKSIYNEDWQADLLRFSHEYANDSDSISDC